MKKTFKNLIALGGLLLLACTASAQIDYFTMPKIVRFPMMGSSNFTTTTSYVTNRCVVDLIGMEGVGTLIVTATNCPVTNGVPTTGKMSINVYGANVPTNGTWAAITNTALANETSHIITNYYAGITNLYVTNFYLCPGYVSNATASVEGFAGQWVTAPVWTNTGVICSSVGGGVFALGIQLASQPRYLQLVLATEGSNTVSQVGAVLIGRTASGRYP